MPATTNTSPHAWGYGFDPATNEYTGPVRLVASLSGGYALPYGTVGFAPAEPIDTFESYQLNAAKDAWARVVDYRGARLFRKATAEPVANTLALGEALPEDLTTEPPTLYGWADCLANAWDDGTNTWKAVPDYSSHPVWEKASAAMVKPPACGEPLPDTVTALPPPGGVHIAAKWDDATEAWDAVADYRGTYYWTPDGEFCLIDELGVEPPDDALYDPPELEPDCDAPKAS